MRSDPEARQNPPHSRSRLKRGRQQGRGWLGRVYNVHPWVKNINPLATISCNVQNSNVREDVTACWLTENGIGDNLPISTPWYTLIINNSLWWPVAIANTSKLMQWEKIRNCRMPHAHNFHDSLLFLGQQLYKLCIGRYPWQGRQCLG